MFMGKYDMNLNSSQIIDELSSRIAIVSIASDC